MKNLPWAAAAVFSALAMTSVAHADHPADFVVHNSTGVAIDSLFISEADNDKWGDDILGVDTLADGEAAKINFKGDPDVCKFDIKVTHGKDAWVVEDVDLCKVNKMKFTKKGNKVFYTRD